MAFRQCSAGKFFNDGQTISPWTDHRQLGISLGVVLEGGDWPETQFTSFSCPFQGSALGQSVGLKG